MSIPESPPLAAARVGGPSESADAEPGGALLLEITRVAQQIFAGSPSNWSPFSHPEPSATQLGAGGVSPAVAPSPVVVPSPALTASPAHTELQLAPTPPTLTSLPPSPALEAPYFLGLAGFPLAPPLPSPGHAPGAPPAPFASGAAPEGHDAAPVLSGIAPDASSAAPAKSSVAPAKTSTDPAELGRSFDFSPELVADSGVPALGTARGPYDAHALKRDFPILEERVHGRPLVWLDNAATTQKPRAVIERLAYFYEHENSNVHRAAHTLAGRATDAYEAARDKVRRFLNASSPREIVFVRGGTEAINLVAQSWGRRHVGAGDEIVISWLEHHANIVPWQMLAQEKGARLRVVPVDDRGQVLLDDYERLLGPRTRLVALTHVSNALGTVVPVGPMTEIAHRYGARVLLDGAQAVSHLPVDVQALGCDFYCFSGHKVYGPTGIGALYGTSDALESMPPWQGGGNMIGDVRFERTTYQPPPGRFEAGTGNIADAVGLGAAIDYVTTIGMPAISAHEHDLLLYATECLATVPGLRIIGTAPDKAGVLSFVLDGQRTEDVGGLLDLEGIAVRSGHHCAQPILRRFGLEASVRASFGLYNTRDDIDALTAALRRLQANRPASAS